MSRKTENAVKKSKGALRSRPTGTRQTRKRFIIACEGAKTERSYLRQLCDKLFSDKIFLEFPPCKSSAGSVLQGMKKRLKSKDRDDGDQAWLVVDVDQNPESVLKELYQWPNQETGYGLALSNPCFEYWLLLHFDEGKSINTPSRCKEELQKHYSDYDKADLQIHRFFGEEKELKKMQEHLLNVIRRAKKRITLRR